MKQDCVRAEILAGAIALNEASDHERDDYRRHIAACGACLRAFGGEREIERVMATVVQARDAEVWDPAPVRATARRAPRVRIAFAGVSVAAFAIVASLGLHGLIATNVKPVVLARQQVAAVPAPAFHITLEKRSPDVLPAPKPTSPPRMVIVHNVITLDRDHDRTKPPVRTTTTTTVVAAASRPQHRDVPVWRRHQAPQTHLGAPEVTAMQPAPVLAGRAESIAVAPSYVVRDAIPLGGDTAINPQPPPIAYAQGAEGTTAFEVSIDEHGSAVKCTITKSSGYLSLDDAVCKAAMKARYSPRTVNGKAVAGIYRDAFTFRSNSSSDSQI